MFSTFSLEIEIRYVEGLKIGKKLIRKNLFVIISSEENGYQGFGREEASTKLCEDDNGYPTWNEKLTTKMPLGTKYIVLDVRHKTRSREKSIAISKVPISDFVSDCTPENYVHFLSYRLRDCEGESNGIINFCVKVIGKLDKTYGKKGKFSEIQGYDNKENGVQKQSNRISYVDCSRKFDDVVIGVPAEWCNTWHR